MTQQDIVRYARRLHSWLPLWRRSACRKLAADASASAVPYLAEALHVDDAEVRATAMAALRALTDARAIDALCAHWAQGRDAHLGRLIAERGYVARQPVMVRVLSALQGNRLEVAGESAAAVPCLLQAWHDSDAELAQRAAAALRALQAPEAVEALCELAIADPTAEAADIVKEANYQPQSVGRRCVLFLLTGQLERYFDLDFELQYLRAEYQAGDAGLRQRIGDVVRQSGDTRLIGLFRASRQRKLASELSAHEAAIVIEVYARNRQWAEIFALLFHVPLSSAIAALDVLGTSGWRPPNDVEAALLGELLAARASVGAISGKSPVPNSVFGPVLARWIARGCSPEFLGQSPDTSRTTLAQGSPPEAVAALAALVTTGESTTDDIEAARTHKHWLVRLAYLGLCDITPQLTFSALPTADDGGGLWIECLAPPAVLVAVLSQDRAVSLTPDQLAALQGALNGANPRRDGRWAYGRLLEALARHHLRHTIEIDEQMTVEIDETAIEIEG